MIDTLLRLKPAVGQGDVHEVGDPLHDDGSGDQGRPPAAGRRLRDQVGQKQVTNMEKPSKKRISRAQGRRWPRRPAWCWPTSAASPSRATPTCAASSGPTAATTRSSRTRSRHAVKGTPMEGIEKLFVGPTAIAYSFEDPAAPAKVADQGRQGGGEVRHQGRLRRRQGAGHQGRRGAVEPPRQRRAAGDFPCNFAGRASELRPAHHRRPAELRLLLAARESALAEGGSEQK